MNTRTWLLAGAAAATVGCSSGGDTGPNDGGAGGNGGGPVGTVIVGNLFFESGHNGTRNAAQDTVAAGQTVTWTWTGTGGTPHSVQSQGSPSFPSSATLSGSGMTYTATFATPGTYRYQCAIHPTQMTGTVVVQ